MYGKFDGKTNHDPTRPKTCQICSTENAPEADFCIRCRRPLNARSAINVENIEKEFLQVISPEIIEKMIQRKVEEILANYLSGGQLQTIKVSA